MTRRRIAVTAWAVAVLGSACATSGGARREVVRAETGVAADFRRDTALSWNPNLLYESAVQHAIPGRATFDPDRAADLLSAFIQRFPTDSRQRDASDRLALINEVRALRAELRGLKAIDLDRPPR